MRFVPLVLLLLLAGCGKVGEPLPPFIRIPEPVQDLKVSQSGTAFILSWTNPSKNIDGSAATDLSRVQVFINGSMLTAANTTTAAQAQTLMLPIDFAQMTSRAFSVRVETTRGKLSAVSNIVSIAAVEVPGTVSRLRSLVDQRRVTLQWEKPVEHSELADAYRVTRSGSPERSELISQTVYEDLRYQAGKMFTYQVTAVRRVDGREIPGSGTASITVTMDDKTPPQVPAGLDLVPSENGAFLTWNANTETDLAGYRVFRSEDSGSGFSEISMGLNTTNAFFDPAYRSGRYYVVSAVDEFGNESARSAPFRSP